MKRQATIIPPQLKCIIQKEGKAKDTYTSLESIDRAKANELRAYLSLCSTRLELPSDST